MSGASPLAGVPGWHASLSLPAAEGRKSTVHLLIMALYYMTARLS